MVEKIPQGYKKTEVGVIPEDWEVKEIHRIADVKTGPFGSALHAEDYVTTGTPIITVEHLMESFISHENLPLVSEVDKVRLKSYLLKTNDIVFSRVGSVDRNAIITEKEDNWLFSGRLIRLRPDQKSIASMFLSQYFHYEPVKQRIRSIAVGQTMASLNTKLMNNFKVASSPLHEQTAIAEALSDVDRLISSLEKLIAKKQNIKQGAMQELLTGKRRLSGFDGDWQEVLLGEICEIKDGTHQTPKYVYSGIPFYSVENVTQNEFANTKFISEYEHSMLTKSCKIEKGDILMTRIGSIGDCKYIDWDVNASFYVSLALLKVKKGFNAKFICQYSNTDYFKKEIEINSLQSAIPKKINLGRISNIKLTTPKSEEEQTAIAQILSDMDEEIAKLTAKLNKYKAIKQGMMQELLTGKRRLV